MCIRDRLYTVHTVHRWCGGAVIIIYTVTATYTAGVLKKLIATLAATLTRAWHRKRALRVLLASFAHPFIACPAPPRRASVGRRALALPRAEPVFAGEQFDALP